MQQLIYALNDIKRDLNVLNQKLSAVDRVLKTGDVSHLMRPIQGAQRSKKSQGQYAQPGFGPQVGQSPQSTQFGQQTSDISGLWGASSTGGSRRNRKRNRKQNVFGGQQSFGGVPPHIAQQAQLTAQYVSQMLKNGTGQQIQS